MQALRIYAGPKAMQHIAQNGLQPQDVGVVPGAAGGPKGLLIGPLERFFFGGLPVQTIHDVHLVGASIGAWRMATACLNNPVAGFAQLEHDYIRQDYALKAGEKSPSADTVSEDFGRNLTSFYAGKVADGLNHPPYKLHIFTSRGGAAFLAGGAKPGNPVGPPRRFLNQRLSPQGQGRWAGGGVFSHPGRAVAVCKK